MKKIIIIVLMFLLVFGLFAQDILSDRQVDAFTGIIKQNFFLSDIDNENTMMVVTIEIAEDQETDALVREDIDIVISEAYTYYGNKNPDMMYKFDDLDLVKTKGLISTNGKGVFINLLHRMEFWEALFTSNKLIVRIFDYNKVAHDYSFDLTHWNEVYNEAMGESE